MTDPALFQAASFFAQTGYVRCPAEVPQTLLQELTRVTGLLFERPTPPYRSSDVTGGVCRVDGLLARHDVYMRTLQSEPVRPLLEALLGPNIEVARFRHNHATLNRAGEVPLRLHRDVQQWTRPVVNVFIYLEPSEQANGATVLVPTSQTIPYCGPQAGGGGGNWADAHEASNALTDQAVTVSMPAGGVLFMNGLTFHSVGVNSTSRTRRSLVFACRSSDDLQHPELVSVEQVAGRARFKGHEGQPISGSLRLGG